MKTKISFDNLFLSLLIILSVVTLAMAVAGCFDAGAMSCAFAATVIPGAAGGKHVVDGPLTTPLTNEASPTLLRNEIDERVTKVRPSATPIDTISRCGGTRLAGSMIVDYYSVDTKPGEARSTANLDPSTGTVMGGAVVYILKTDNDAIFDASETILVKDVMVAQQDGRSMPLVLYVVSHVDGGGIKVVAVNGTPDASDPRVRRLPAIPAGSLLVRMGRAAAELDVQTPQFNALPVKSTNYCQIFKAQVEQSTYQKIANKEVGWTFSDQEEIAIVDMRTCLERSFLFGCKNRIYDPGKGDEIMLTGGIWHQAGCELQYDDDLTVSDFILSLCRKAFTGNSGSKRKVLIAGSNLIDYLSRHDATNVLHADDTVTHWGIDFKELHSKYGTLLVVHSEVFDSCGMPGNGMVIDPEYITKYSHVPFQTEVLDLKTSGQRNTEAVVITEASCLVLRYPAAHVRIEYIGE